MKRSRRPDFVSNLTIITKRPQFFRCRNKIQTGPFAFALLSDPVTGSSHLSSPFSCRQRKGGEKRVSNRKEEGSRPNCISTSRSLSFRRSQWGRAGPDRGILAGEEAWWLIGRQLDLCDLCASSFPVRSSGLGCVLLDRRRRKRYGLEV